MTYRKATCARCGCGVVALEDEIRPLCVDCARTEKMELRRQGTKLFTVEISDGGVKVIQ